MLGFLDAGELNLKYRCKDGPIRNTESRTYCDDATHCMSISLNGDKDNPTLRLFTHVERSSQKSFPFLLA